MRRAAASTGSRPRRALGLLLGGFLGLVVLAGLVEVAAAEGRTPAGGVTNAVVLADLPEPRGPATDPDQVRQRAKDILSQPAYQPPPETWFDRLRRAVSDLLDRILGGLAGGGTGSAFGIIVLAALVGLVVFLAFRFGRTVQRAPDQAVEVTIEERRTAIEWRTEAERYEAAGQWKDALRCRYRALAVDLQARRVVPDVPGRTVGEHRTDVHQQLPGVASEFDGAAELFEQAWYGDVPTGAQENARFRELSDEVLRERSR